MEEQGLSQNNTKQAKLFFSEGSKQLFLQTTTLRDVFLHSIIFLFLSIF